MSATVSAATLKSWLHDGREIALLDVREHGQYGDPPACATITAQALCQRQQRGEVALIDLRPGMQYRETHAAGAR